jgi:hypothetical protein
LKFNVGLLDLEIITIKIRTTVAEATSAPIDFSTTTESGVTVLIIDAAKPAVRTPSTNEIPKNTRRFQIGNSVADNTKTTAPANAPITTPASTPDSNPTNVTPVNAAEAVPVPVNGSDIGITPF